jgi:predicted RecA/RadA family phage recombinase
MTKAEKFQKGDYLSLAVTHPATPASGDPVRLNKTPGVAMTAERADGTTSVALAGVFNLNVDDDAATGIAPGDRIYYQDTGTGSPATSLNNNATTPEAVFGIALGTLSANATGVIPVRIGAPPLT